MTFFERGYLTENAHELAVGVNSRFTPLSPWESHRELLNLEFTPTAYEDLRYALEKMVMADRSSRVRRVGHANTF